jgi:hypothetical protein
MFKNYLPKPSVIKCSLWKIKEAFVFLPCLSFYLRPTTNTYGWANVLKIRYGTLSLNAAQQFRLVTGLVHVSNKPFHSFS